MSGTLVILNPAARGANSKALTTRIKQLSSEIIVRTTSTRGQAKTIAKKAVKEGFHTVIAAGGDGTINEVVNGLARADITLGILPVGTMNVFAAELGIPSGNLARCWEIIEAGHIRRIDLPRANGHYFVQLAGVGLDAQVVQETSWNFKKNFGPLSYIVSATQIATRTPPHLIVEADDETREGSFVLIGNGRLYGGPFVIFKKAEIDDGKLDVLIFKNLGYLDIVRYLGGIVFGSHLNFPDVEYFQTRKLKVHSEQEVPVEVDGEVIGNLPVTFRLSSHKLKVLAPEKQGEGLSGAGSEVVTNEMKLDSALRMA